MSVRARALRPRRSSQPSSAMRPAARVSLTGAVFLLALLGSVLQAACGLPTRLQPPTPPLPVRAPCSWRTHSISRFFNSLRSVAVFFNLLASSFRRAAVVGRRRRERRRCGWGRARRAAGASATSAARARRCRCPRCPWGRPGRPPPRRGRGAGGRARTGWPPRSPTTSPSGGSASAATASTSPDPPTNPPAVVLANCNGPAADIATRRGRVARSRRRPPRARPRIQHREIPVSVTRRNLCTSVDRPCVGVRACVRPSLLSFALFVQLVFSR